MRVLHHHIYEYKKGLRNLVLHTLNSAYKEEAEERLISQTIPYVIRDVTPTKINIFFGASECVAVIKQMGNKPLNCFTPEEDYILGIMLGYDRLQQCRRYIQMCNQSKELNPINNRSIEEVESL